MLQEIAAYTAYCNEQAQEAEQCAAMAPPETKPGWDEIAKRWRQLALRFELAGRFIRQGGATQAVQPLLH